MITEDMLIIPAPKKSKKRPQADRDYLTRNVIEDMLGQNIYDKELKNKMVDSEQKDIKAEIDRHNKIVELE